MKNTLHRIDTIFFWLPRILAILFIVFLGLFAFDVFEPGKPILYMIGAFLIHLIPNFILAVLLFIAWKKEKLGGILFILLAFVFTIYYRTYTHFTNFLVVSFPVFLIGMLFIFYNFRITRKL